MIKGIDISHHNKNMKDPVQIKTFDFVIMKASEGATYRDPALSYYMNILEDGKAVTGFYHFARPENGNSPQAEAENFLRTIRNYKPPFILALDVEAGALNYKDLDNWTCDWCKYVYKSTGIKPMIYCSEAECKRFKKCAEFSCGLWVAKWSNNRPSSAKIKPWKIWAIWQYSDKGIVSGVRTDLNYFNGDKNQLLKYAECN